jgi:hypothetical protein
VQRLEHRRHMLLLEFVSSLVQRYSTLWLKHSRTTRLSAVESLADAALWRDVRTFIREYGSDLFHARMLTLGNVRTILHNGVDEFLDFLEDMQDALHPIKLVEDIEQGAFDRDQAVEYLELIYAALVDRIDRFVEYNTTTTQSDYGEMFYCFLDFLRVEAAYERDAWNLTPFVIVHEQLAAHAPPEVARLWESVFEKRNADAAARHVQRLLEVEKTHGMHLPALTDRIEERFVKPLSVNRMVALVRPAIADARAGRKPSASFNELQREIQAYLESTSGSGVDVAPWLRSIERQIRRVAPYEDAQEAGEFPTATPASKRPEVIGLRKLRRQFRRWEDAARKRNPPTA